MRSASAKKAEADIEGAQALIEVVGVVLARQIMKKKSPVFDGKNCGIDAKKAEALAKIGEATGKSCFESHKTIILSNNPLADAGLDSLSIHIAASSTVANLELNAVTKVTDQGWADLFLVLEDHAMLTSLVAE